MEEEQGEDSEVLDAMDGWDSEEETGANNTGGGAASAAGAAASEEKGEQPKGGLKAD